MFTIPMQKHNGLCCLKHPSGIHTQYLLDFALLDQLWVLLLVVMDLNWGHRLAVVL